jgi:hypothetical protein
MGAACRKANNVESAANTEGGVIGVMFKRIDKEKKGYISEKNLEDMMRDDKTHFQGKDADHIMQKYGSDGKMSFVDFQTWWNSTYTTYNDDALGKIVEDVEAENSLEQHMEPIPELPEVPHNSNVAVSRS